MIGKSKDINRQLMKPYDNWQVILSGGQAYARLCYRKMKKFHCA